MRRLAATVTIVSTGDGNRRHGITATAVTSFFMGPDSLLVCINRSSALYLLIREARRFCVNLLTSQQATLSDNFSERVVGDARFAHGDWQEDASGVPFLAGAQANIFCLRRNATEFSSHAIIVGEVADVRIAERAGAAH